MLAIGLAMRAMDHIDRGPRNSRPAWRRRACATVAAALALSAAAAGAINLPAAADQYAAALASIEHTRGRQPLQDLFELGIRASPGVQAIVFSLSDEQLAALKKKMVGFVIDRDETPLVRPSAEFFRKLARRKGTRADRAFFDVYARTEPDTAPAISAYIRPGADKTPGCTQFQSPIMIELYRGWLGFRTEYPDDYATEAQGELDSLDAELSAGTCACGSASQVERGLEAFARAFPDVPISVKVRERIGRIRAGTSHITFDCKG
jgi:hypothetical protein